MKQNFLDTQSNLIPSKPMTPIVLQQNIKYYPKSKVIKYIIFQGIMVAFPFISWFLEQRFSDDMFAGAIGLLSAILLLPLLGLIGIIIGIILLVKYDYKKLSFILIIISLLLLFPVIFVYLDSHQMII